MMKLATAHQLDSTSLGKKITFKFKPDSLQAEVTIHAVVEAIVQGPTYTNIYMAGSRKAYTSVQVPKDHGVAVDS
ncbi:hypothetical protein [Herbiconiux sp.]|uniref:hypothetical protein n=1 Tax=Herbiconiux sp. TaxID=1871186 RepID=UPI0025B7F63F|nr:hypothetical protein [Herbiconiux sp.]